MYLTLFESAIGDMLNIFTMGNLSSKKNNMHAILRTESIKFICFRVCFSYFFLST